MYNKEIKVYSQRKEKKRKTKTLNFSLAKACCSKLFHLQKKEGGGKYLLTHNAQDSEVVRCKTTKGGRR
jgi:hypothetical protein